MSEAPRVSRDTQVTSIDSSLRVVYNFIRPLSAFNRDFLYQSLNFQFQDSFFPRRRVASTSSLGSAHNTAVHSKFRDLETRLATFGNNFDPQLADLGFFVDAQRLTCFFCGLILDDVPDNVIVEHLVEKPGCEHARLMHTLHRMQSLSERLKSFEGFDNLKERLARGGFFQRRDDGRTQCAYCRIIVDTWVGVESVFDEHAKLALTCPFVLNPPEYAFRGEDEAGHQQNLIKHSRPQYSNMVSPDARLRTFEKWTGVVDKHHLVECGLFSLNLNDFTKCFQCGGGLGGWQADDDPWREHARWYPECEFVRLVKGQEYVDAVVARSGGKVGDLERQDSTEPALPAPLAAELDLILNSKELDKYEKQGVQRTVLRVALKTFMVQMQRGFSSPEEISSVLESTLHLKPMRKRSGDDPETPSDETLCVVCLMEKRGAAFLPCGHMVACHKCAASVADCPLCRQPIDQIVRTYLN